MNFTQVHTSSQMFFRRGLQIFGVGHPSLDLIPNFKHMKSGAGITWEFTGPDM